MPLRERFCALLMWVLAHGVWCVDISFDNPADGFFLKSMYQKNKAWDPLVKTENFVLTRPSDLYNLKATSGPFEVHQVIQDDLLPYSHEPSKPSLVHHDVVYDFDVSAHVISDKLLPKWPKLQVLIHASPHSDKVRQRGKGTKVKSSSSKAGFRHMPRMWCGHIYAQTTTKQLTAICVLSEKDNACVASISIPQAWFHPNTTLHVSYAFSHAEQNQECASASNSIVPGKAFEHPLTSKPRYITPISLASPDKTYDIKRDKQVRIYVPTEYFTPGSVVEVPVNLEANSDLQVFVMRARVRNGLKITSAIAEADSPWQIHVDVNDRQKVGTVTARIDLSKYNTSRGEQEVFRWRMEVEDNVSNIGTARIVWIIEYERNKQMEYYTGQESRVNSLINIRSQELERLVPILKVTEILNLALLTGRRQVYPLKVYSVKESDKLTDVSQTTACHSAEEDVLKVSKNCSSVYIDGTERRGSHNVTIITKFGWNTAFINVRVWIPAEPLEIQLSDNRLSHIRGWKVLTKHSSKSSTNRRGRTRNKRVIDFGILSHPSVYHFPKKNKKYSRGTASCSLHLQQSLVEVYAKFFIASPSGTDYYRGKQSALRVTDLLLDRLRVSDQSIASLNGNVIQGHSHGRAEIQVMSPKRRVIAGKEIRVGNDRVTVERLIITMVTRITLEVLPSHEIPGALTAISHIEERLHTKYQEAILEISIQYSDGSRFPLRYVNPADYLLEVSPLNHNTIGVSPYMKPYQPRIVALGEGRGELLKAVLKMSDQCLRKRSKSLAVRYLVIDSDFSPMNIPYNDPRDIGSSSDRNRPSNTHGVYTAKSITPLDLPDHLKNEKKEEEMKFNIKKKTMSNVSVIPVGKDVTKDLKDSPLTKKEPVKNDDNNGELTPLEIGMYVILAVFCVGIVVFLIHCVVFMVRYKRKRMPRNKKETESRANDWVWIGRATLERNAINTRCSQTLMPAEDFNGNHTQVVPSTSSGLGSSCSNSNSSSAQASNRSSFVSTIKGSECSIRITANPLLETSDKTDNNSQQQIIDPEWDYEAMGMTYDQLVNYFDNLKESTA